MTALLALILSTYRAPVVVLGSLADTGMGKCTMDQHYHNQDGMCHWDSDDHTVKLLPKVTQ